ncbi:MAG TPA: T9SS type A sorting domain-containing protein [Rubricoccaceae bacterium]
MSPSVTPRTRALLQDSLWYAAAAAAVGVAPEAAAQIVYTNVEPDAVIVDTFTGQTIAGPEFDLDGDGTTEIQFAERGSAAAPSRYIIAAFGETVTSIVANIVPFGGADYAYFLPLAAGTSIGNTSPTLPVGADAESFGAATFTFGGSDPNGFLTGSDTYIGLMFNTADGSSHNAWLRVQVPVAGGQITLKDYAYEATPNVAIAAGAGATATEPDALAEGYRFSPLAPNPTTGTSTFDVAVGQTETVRVEAFDALGRSVAVLHDGLIAAGQTRQLSLDGSRLPAGVYVVRVAGESFTTSRRVSVVR